MEQNIIAVSQVNEYIKFLLDRDELLTNLCVRGEVSNYKIYPSGHHYFRLMSAERTAPRKRTDAIRIWCAARMVPCIQDGRWILRCV